MKIEVDDLKLRLSECLDRAASGEQVIVTERGTPIVRILEYGERPVRFRSDFSVLEILEEDRG